MIRRQLACVDLHGLYRLGDAGIVDENIDMAEGLDDLLRGAVGRLAPGHITDNADMTRAQACGSLPGRGFIKIGDRNARTMSGEQARCRQPDTARARSPRNYGGFAVEQHGRSPNIFCCFSSGTIDEIDDTDKRVIYN